MWIWEQDPEAIKEAQQELDDFYTEQEIDNIDKRIEKLEEEVKALENSTKDSEDAYDKRLKMLDDQIEKAEEYKDKWNNVKTEYENAQNAIIAKAKLGANAEKGILEGRAKVLNDFKTGYTTTMDKVAEHTEDVVDRINTALLGINIEEIIESVTGKIGGIQEGDMTIGTTGRVKAQIITGESGDKFLYNPITKRYYREEDATYDSETGRYTVKSGTLYFTETYASGTLSAKAGLANVDEKGSELIVPRQGRYRMMEYGDTVVPHNLSQRLFDVASNPLRFIANALNSVKTPNLMSNSSRISNASTINIGTIELPSVTNGESFVRQLQLISMNR